MFNFISLAKFRYFALILSFLFSFNSQAATSISGLWPGNATVGETISVFVFGSEFTTDGSTQVQFNGVQQFFVAPVSPEMLIVRVTVAPELFGPVTVTSPNGTAVSSTDFGLIVTGLEITGVWPGYANTGDNLSVFIFGSNFTTDGSAEVRFNGVLQYLVAPVTPDMLIVRIANATPDMTGFVNIVTPGGSTTSTDMFIVQDPVGPANWGGFLWDDGSTWQ